MKNLKKLLFYAALTLSFSCHDTKQVTETSYVVLEFNKDWYWIYENAKPAELNKSEIRIIEEVLNGSFVEYNKSNADYVEEYKLWLEKTHPDKEFNKSWPKLIIDLKDYKRQYFPIINEKGEKEVWINLFCTTELTNWKEEVVIYFDGGTCFINLKINLENQSYYDFRVNGNA